ncbi:MAG: DUF4345 family protein [Planctomycetota bacterium]
MSRRLPHIVIWTTALAWVGFAIWLGSNPRALPSAFGVATPTPAMLTEVRAFYGGVEGAIAIVMLVLWWRGELVASLLIGGMPLIGSATGRCLGLMVDGFSALHLGFASLECIGAVFCLVGCLIISRKTEVCQSDDLAKS